MSCAVDDYMWNMPIPKHHALPFYAFLEICSIAAPAGFHYDLCLRLVDDSVLDVLCTVPFRVLELIEHHGIFRLLERTSGNLEVGSSDIR